MRNCAVWRVRISLLILALKEPRGGDDERHAAGSKAETGCGGERAGARQEALQPRGASQESHNYHLWRGY